MVFQSRQPNSSCSVERTVSSSRSEGYKQQIMGPLCYIRYSKILVYHSLHYSIACALSFSLGPSPNEAQDSFMYRVQNGVRSLLLDDDNCDCHSTLSMGHGLCGSGFSTSYGPSGRFGVYDTYCQTPDPKHGLSLYFRGMYAFMPE